MDYPGRHSFIVSGVEGECDACGEQPDDVIHVGIEGDSDA
jgi:hypothetical protein